VGSSLFTYHGLSETGPVREENQDALLLPRDPLPGGSAAPTPPGVGVVFALADGIGGYAHGGRASQAALQALFDACCKPANPSARRMLKRAVGAANLAVINEAARLGAARMGTTLTAACLDGARLHLAHVGDSRAYLIRGGAAKCLTQDHSLAGDLLRMGVISPAQVREHARRSVLTKAVGLALFVQPDVFSVDLRPGDRLILCSDGVWSVIQDEEFALPEPDVPERKSEPDGGWFQRVFSFSRKARML
jgi:PPM family protein phosphatase